MITIPGIPPEVIRIVQAAYLAEGALEHANGVLSMGTASRAIWNYERLLMDATPDLHELLDQIHDGQGKPLPTLVHLHGRYIAVLSRVYATHHHTAALSA